MIFKHEIILIFILMAYRSANSIRCYKCLGNFADDSCQSEGYLSDVEQCQEGDICYLEKTYSVVFELAFGARGCAKPNFCEEEKKKYGRKLRWCESCNTTDKCNNYQIKYIKFKE
ncbi:hypothetical protein HHI36_005695 [Cryptolaemus montrouzieri]|uniref:UPAR/Ly6 domain-containing protein n=1 Tax=Cryptolaemus montrouzieri TaxID=559131 RepID=A0ABD2NUY2_9CUCU